jgi:O-antigen/teichoic acid export membrane protein
VSTADPIPSAAAPGAVSADGSADVRMVARGGAVNLVGAIATGVFQFLLVVAVARVLRRAQSGAFFEAVALFTILSNTCELGADTGLTRFIPLYRADGRIADIRQSIRIGMWPSLISGIVFAAIAFIFAGPLAEIFANHHAADADHVATYVRTLALFLPVACCYTVTIAATRGFGTMVPNAVIDRTARPVLQFALVAIVLVFTDNPALIASAWATPFAIGLLAGLLWLSALVRRVERRATSGPMVAAAPPRRLFREFWNFTAPRGLTGAFQISLLWIGPLMVGSLVSTPDASVYTAATRYLVAGGLVNTAIIQVIAPKLSELISAGFVDRTVNIYHVATAWLVMLAWPMYLTLAVWASVLLKAFGHHYQGGASSLTVLALAMVVATGIGPIDMVLLMGGRSSLNLLNVAVALALNVVVGFALIPSLGVVGAALGLAAAIIFNNIAPLVEVRTFISINPVGRAFPIVTAASVVCFAGIGLLTRSVIGASLAGFAVSVVISGAIYVVVMGAFRERLELPVLWRSLHRRSQSHTLGLPVNQNLTGNRQSSE